MVRKLLIALIIFMSIVCAVGVYLKMPTKDPVPNGTIVDRKNQFSAIPKTVELPAVVAEINAANAKVTNLSCDSVQYLVWESGHCFKLSGELYYEKPVRFRMQIESLLGKEVDVGSNDKHLWYWSRRDPKPGLHFAAHEDLNKTRLKAPFNPAFLRSTLGFEHLPPQNVKIVENQTDLMLVYPQQTPTGQPVLFSVLINKARKQVDGCLITDQSGKVLAASEIQQYNNGVPVKILYSWYEENRTMLMTLKNPKVNTTISGSAWAMPNYTPKSNMAETD